MMASKIDLFRSHEQATANAEPSPMPDCVMMVVEPAASANNIKYPLDQLTRDNVMSKTDLRDQQSAYSPLTRLLASTLSRIHGVAASCE